MKPLTVEMEEVWPVCICVLCLNFALQVLQRTGKGGCQDSCLRGEWCIVGQKHEQFLVPRDAQLQLFTQELLQKSQSAWPVRGILLSLGSKMESSWNS